MSAPACGPRGSEAPELFLLPAYSARRVNALELDGSTRSVLALSSEYACVHSLQKESGLSFSVIRHTAAGSAEICGTGFAPATLPFPDSHFDLLFGRTILGLIPLDSQLPFLAGLRPFLAQGGKLVIGCENSLGSNRLGHGAHTTLALRTLPGYLKLLKRAGYQHITGHLAIPTHTDTKYTCQISRSSLRRFYEKHYPRPTRFLPRLALNTAIALRMAHYFESAFLFEASA